jgi:hypothetical protein
MEQLAALEQQGAHHYQRARFRYLKSLAQRLAHSRLPAAAQQRKLDRALADYRTDLLKEKANAKALVEQLAQPGNGIDRDLLQQHLASGDFKTLHRLAARQQRPPSPLLQLLEALRADHDTDPTTEPASALDIALQQQQNLLQHRPDHELKALRNLRVTLSHLHTQQRIHHAITRAPGDAGPLNAHRQVTRAIETLRDVSPAYLERFVGYMDALMVLEKIGKKG